MANAAIYGNSGWSNAVYINTATTAAPNAYTTWYTQAGTGSATTFQQYAAPRLSAAEMIAELGNQGHVVLKKKEHFRSRGLPVWDYSKVDLSQDLAAFNRFFGYALPEQEGDYLMPDGSTLHVDQYGNYKILDQDSKVVYKANRIREFNPYVSAADLVESFIKEVGRIDGVKQTEVLGLPIEAFINWLILQAAKKDGDSIDGLPSVENALPAPIPALPRCLDCGRFLSRAWAAMRVTFCSQSHMRHYESKQRALVPA